VFAVGPERVVGGGHKANELAKKTFGYESVDDSLHCSNLVCSKMSACIQFHPSFYVAKSVLIGIAHRDQPEFNVACTSVNWD